MILTRSKQGLSYLATHAAAELEDSCDPSTEREDWCTSVTRR
jgi:hypothetical protein